MDIYEFARRMPKTELHAHLERISLNGLRSSLLPEDGKARLEAEFQAEFIRLRQEMV